MQRVAVNQRLGRSQLRPSTATAPTVRRCAVVPSVRRVGRSRRAVVVSAGLGDWFSSVTRNFLSILSPSRDEGVDWSGTTHNYKGSSRQRRQGKPFNDGFPGGVRAKVEEVKETVAEVKDSLPPATQAKLESDNLQEKAEGMIEYVNKAAERVVGHNFKGDATEPEEWKSRQGAGWKGDIHKRENRDKGFHSKVL